MKKMIKVSLLGLGFAGIAMFACQKKPITENPAVGSQITPQVSENTNTAAKPIPGANATHWSDGWCRGNPNNCIILKEIVIIRPKWDLIRNAMQEGTPEAIGEAFSSPDLADIVAALPAEMAADLQSGGYYLNISNQNATTACLRAGTTSPVTAENLEFAFQINKN